MIFEWELYNLELTFRIIVMLVGVAVVATFLLLLFGADNAEEERPASPLEILAYRYRRGEIDDKEYNRLRNALQH